MLLPKEAKHQLEQSLRTADWELFKSIRYTYGQEGDVFLIEDLDLSGLKLGKIPSDFLCFKNCNLEGASFSGKQFWPTSLWSCKAKNLDLRSTHGMLYAYLTDLKGVVFDETTELFPSYHTDAPSAFEQCELDNKFKEFLLSQGATLSFPQSERVPAYAFAMPHELEKQLNT